MQQFKPSGGDSPIRTHLLQVLRGFKIPEAELLQAMVRFGLAVSSNADILPRTMEMEVCIVTQMSYQTAYTVYLRDTHTQVYDLPAQHTKGGPFHDDCTVQHLVYTLQLLCNLCVMVLLWGTLS